MDFVIEKVRSDMFGDWPLTVSVGYIKKYYNNAITFRVFENTGIEFALNGIANQMGFPDISPLWSDNPDVPGIKKDLGALIGYGLSL